ncbi:MAG: hypothetical protein LBC48_07440 [Dysgonamonadaceae bacterium]|jgi:hypothetical protein|nr:hypothetical protein [Dysgonamonadaceae bacterium]
MKPICIFLLLCISALPLQAQNTAAKDSLLNREMTLEKEYSPTIEPAAKVNQLPELREPQAPKSKVEFSDYSTAYEVRPGLNSLMPKSMLADLNTSKYAGYASLRLSTLLDFDGDAAYRILNTDRDFLDIYLSHRSSNSKNPSLQVPSETQKFYMNDNWGGFNFTHSFDNAKLSAGFKYTYSEFNYSESPVTTVSSTGGLQSVYQTMSHPNQTNNMLDAHTSIFSDTPNKLNYKVNLRYTYFKQKYIAQTTPGVRENRVIIDWDLHDNYNSTSGFGFSGFYKTYKYSSEEFRIYAKNDDIMLFSVFSLNPYYYIEGDNLNLRLGFRADFELGGRKKSVVSPDIRFNYNPSEVFTFYASALGGLNDNSNYDMFYENRYIYPFERILDSRTYVDGTAGLRYLPVSNLSLDIFAGYRLTKDEHFFYPYKVVYYNENELIEKIFMGGDYGTANVTKLGARVNYTIQNHFGINLKGTFYNWDVTRTDTDANGAKMEAYHKPQFEAETDVYFHAPNIPLRMDLTFKGQFGRKLFSEEPSMRDVYDLSIKTSYAFAPFFSVYLATNNLFFQKYDIWYGYPAQKFNIMGGISVMF